TAAANDQETLAIDLADDDRSKTAHRHAKLDLKTGELTQGSKEMHAEAGKHLPKKLVHWAVDTVRAVPWIGPAPVAWLEEKTFALKDTMKQAAFKATRGTDDLAGTPEVRDAPAAILDT